MRVMALDIGEVRVGVAVGSTETRVATVAGVLPAAEVEGMARPFRLLVEDHEPQLLVCGLPLTLAGERGPQAVRVEKVARSVADALGLPLEFTDERLSSSQAKRYLREQGLSEKKMRGRVDGVAASLFLQAWLDRQSRTTLGDS